MIGRGRSGERGTNATVLPTMPMTIDTSLVPRTSRPWAAESPPAARRGCCETFGAAEDDDEATG